MSAIQVSAFRWVPPFAQGLVRDLRVRWALGEAGLDYDEQLIDREDQKTEAYRRLQPFGQVPALVEGDQVLFESGAIVLHLADRSPALMPEAAAEREQVRSWSFAALNTIEPPISMLVTIDLQPEADRRATARLRETIVQRIEGRLDALAAFLGERAHLVGDRFSAADLLMTTVLRILRTTDLVTRRPALDAYRQRFEARPAFKAALAAQLRAFEANAPAGPGP